MLTATRLYRDSAAQNEREQLIFSHLGLVRHLVGKLLAQLPPGVDAENLESAGILGLVEATNKFDPSRGIQFKTFAYPRIRGAILDELRRNSPLPRQMLQNIARVRKAHAELTEFGSVTVEALAAATGLTPDEVTDCLAAMRMTRMISRDSGSGAESSTGEDEDRPDTRLEQAERQQVLAQAIAALPEREREVVTLYYLNDLRLREIAEVIGLSESRVSRLLNGALFAIRQYMQVKEG